MNQTEAMIKRFLPNARLTLATSGATAADGTAGTNLQNILTAVVPEGEVWGFPRFAHIIAKLMSDGSGNQISRYAEIGFALKTPGDPNRTIPWGSQMFPYTDYYDLTTAQQRDTDYKERFIQELSRESCPVVVLQENETFLVQVYDSALGVDVSESVLEIPFFRGHPGSINAELKLRRIELGR